jgi:YfiH family protein
VPDSEVPLLRWDAAGALGADVAVTTRHGGVSRPPYDSLNLGLHVGDDADAVATNRRRAAQAFGVELAELVFARQVHGAHVAPVRSADGGRGVTGDDDAVAEADVLVTEGPGVTPVIMVADCVPMALVDPVARVLAGVHAGWRGTSVGVVGAALDAMAERGAHRARIRAFVGPAVAPERYQVTDEVVRALADAVGPVPLEPGVARPDGPGHWLVDLVAANRQQLQLGGVHGDHIDECGVSTADERFFSDRAARPCGRFALLARLVE